MDKIKELELEIRELKFNNNALQEQVKKHKKEIQQLIGLFGR
jgi:FtsZ-binding cell division protein ZapB